MEYQVSARKWRPQKFAELVGQEHIVRTLTNAVRLGRVSHAYVFSGTRGVGKTTTARIFAKALNCEKGPAQEPCDVCRFCEEIRDGRCVDVQEIDGASNTGVAEVRDIIDNVRYAASACRYKIYIIDEVHMLSRNAFNALLKTLEEPPPGVVFIFATTEEHKIPETILSRCQCFEFKPLSQKQIVKQMQNICTHEKVSIDALSLEEIARTGAGSMRDAQSLLDQVVAYCGREVNSGDVEAVLGIVGGRMLETFVDRIAERDAEGLLALIRDVSDGGKDLHFFCRDLIDHFRNLMVVALTKNPEALLDAQACDFVALRRQATTFDADRIQQMFNILCRTETEMKRSTLPRQVLEMAVLRLTDARPFRDLDALIEKVNALGAGGATPVPVVDEAKKKIPVMQPEAKVETRDAATEPAALDNTPVIAAADAGGQWSAICDAMVRQKPHFVHYLNHCRVVALTAVRVHLEFPDPFTLKQIGRDENQKVLKAAIAEVCGGGVELQMTVVAPGNGGDVKANSADETAEKKSPPVYNASTPGADASAKKSESEIIQDAMDIFGGVVIR